MVRELFRFERDKYIHSSRMILPMVLLFFIWASHIPWRPSMCWTASAFVLWWCSF